ncbi:MAG: methylenetetrahydrofolate reductase [NAD(P)H] [Pseudomonadota bacterium]
MTLDNKRLSFEFFPTKTPEGLAKLSNTCEQLNAYEPEFFSVTYGAGGSTRDNTLNVVKTLRANGISIAPHLSFGNDNNDTLLTLLNDYKSLGVDRIVALRGDIPSGTGMTDPVYAEQLVRFIREHTDDHFHLEVAAYPEIHPQAPSYDKDVHFLKKKLDAGANTAITQYFFNSDAYFYFLDECHAQGIEQPIYPGIMPIINFTNLQRFSNACGADIPRWITQRIEAFGDDQEAIQAFGCDVVSRLCQELLDGGAPGLHFYTMNQAKPTERILKNL